MATFVLCQDEAETGIKPRQHRTVREKVGLLFVSMLGLAHSGFNFDHVCQNFALFCGKLH